MRAYYRSTIAEFLASSPELVLHKLEDGFAADGFNRTPEQRLSWRGEIDALNTGLIAVRESVDGASEWGLLLEYPIPGRQKRLDAVLLTSRGILSIEFKVGKTEIVSGDKAQVLEYCWNLRDFHRASAGRLIAPILVPTELTVPQEKQPLVICDARRCILTLQVAGKSGLALAIREAFAALPDSDVKMPSLEVWDQSRIAPSQSIIEATRELFGRHSVREIEHSHADNTDEVVEHIADIVKHSRAHRRRSICFVTGVPGAGKTLVGLRVAYRSQATALAASAPCFASGNLKLLKVLGKALGLNLAKSKTDIRRTVHDLTAPLWMFTSSLDCICQMTRESHLHFEW